MEQRASRRAATGGLVLAILAANNVVRNVGFAMVNITLPTHVRDVLGLDYGAYGLLLGAFSIVNAFLEPVFAHAAEKLGYRRVILASLCIFAAGTVACALATGFWDLLVARLVQGGGSYYSAMFLLVDRTTRDEARPRAFSIFMVTMTAGWVIGTLLGGILDPILGAREIFLIMAALIAACIVASAFLPGTREEARLIATTTAENDVPGKVDVLAAGDYARLVAITVLRNLTFQAVLSFLLFYIGMFLAAWGAGSGLSGVVILPMVGSYIAFTLLGGGKRFLALAGTRRAIALPFALLAVLFVLFGPFFQAMLHPRPPVACTIFLFFGFTILVAAGFGLPQSPVATRVMTTLPAKGRGFLAGMFNTAGFAAAAVGPVLLSAIVAAEQAGDILAPPHASFVIVAILAAAGLVLGRGIAREPRATARGA